MLGDIAPIKFVKKTVATIKRQEIDRPLERIHPAEPGAQLMPDKVFVRQRRRRIGLTRPGRRTEQIQTFNLSGALFELTVKSLYIFVYQRVSPRLLLPHGRVRNRSELIVGGNVRPRDKASVPGRPMHRNVKRAFRITRLGDPGKRTGSREDAFMFES